VKRAITWLYASRLLVAAIAGTILTIFGAATLAGLLAAHYYDTWIGIAAAATVGGAATTRAALTWSGLSVIEESSK
jgi:hypothetical protein